MSEPLETIAFEKLLKQPELCDTLGRSVCRQMGIVFDGTRCTDGSQLVYDLGGHQVLKIFNPTEDGFCRAEALYLQHLHQRLPISTPALIATGEYGRYPYVLMEKLAGCPLKKVWHNLDASEQRSLMQQLGEVVRTLHSLPVTPFIAGPFQWQTLIDRQRSDLAKNHARYKLNEKWLEQIPAYVEEHVPDLNEPGQMGPLHTELMLEHLFVEQCEGRWRLSGLIDFEPSMVGHRLYEFCAVGIFVSAGNHDLFNTFVTAYGCQDSDLTAAFSDRVMAMLLLHRYCNLPWFFTLLPDTRPMDTLQQLAQYWYGV